MVERGNLVWVALYSALDLANIVSLDLTDGLTVKYAVVSTSDPKAVEPTAVEAVEPVVTKAKDAEPAEKPKASEPVIETTPSAEAAPAESKTTTT